MWHTKCLYLLWILYLSFYWVHIPLKVGSKDMHFFTSLPLRLGAGERLCGTTAWHWCMVRMWLPIGFHCLNMKLRTRLSVAVDCGELSLIPTTAWLCPHTRVTLWHGSVKTQTLKCASMWHHSLVDTKSLVYSRPKPLGNKGLITVPHCVRISLTA